MRQSLVLAAFVLWAVSAFAQEPRTVITELPRAQRLGVTQTGTIDIPSDAVGVLRFVVDLPTAQYEDPANALYYQLYRFDPTLGTWRFVAGGHWQGGRRTDPEQGLNPMPYLQMDLANFRGQQLRAEIDSTGSVRAGMKVDTGPTWMVDPHRY